MNAETEFLEMLVKTCKQVRDPKRPHSRTEMAIPAAQWEMRFTKRLEELKRPIPAFKHEPEEVHA